MRDKKFTPHFLSREVFPHHTGVCVCTEKFFGNRFCIFQPTHSLLSKTTKCSSRAHSLNIDESFKLINLMLLHVAVIRIKFSCPSLNMIMLLSYTHTHFDASLHIKINLNDHLLTALY
jgi:hypothetical protein